MQKGSIISLERIGLFRIIKKYNDEFVQALSIKSYIKFNEFLTYKDEMWKSIGKCGIIVMNFKE